MTALKRFNALHQVNAKPMTRQEYLDLRGWELPADEDGSDEGYLTETVGSNYRSWMPKDIFEAQFYAVDDKKVGVKCTAPQDPNHVLTADEIKRLAETGSLCDCMEVVDYSEREHPIKEGDHVNFGTALHLMELGERVQRANLANRH